MKKNKPIVSIVIVIICIIIGIVIAKIIINNSKPKCPNEYNYDEDSNLCIRILETDMITTTEYYCITGNLINGMCHWSNYSMPSMPTMRIIESCPDGYTKNRSGLPGMDVPYLVPPGVVKKCYRRITTTPQ